MMTALKVKLKGWKTRLYIILHAIVFIANEGIAWIPKLALDDETTALVTKVLVITLVIGTAILRELTNTKAGSAM